MEQPTQDLNRANPPIGDIPSLAALRTGIDRPNAARVLNVHDLGELTKANATPVVSNARKFIIRMPDLGDGGEALVYPRGHQKAGEPITDWQGKPIEGRGLVFFNGKDQCWQAARTDGQSVIIINGVTEMQAEALYGKIEQLGGNPAKLSLVDVKDLIEFANGHGLIDMYNSDTAFIKEKMTPARDADRPYSEIGFGYMKRDDRDTCYAVWAAGPVNVVSGTATPQVCPEGAVLVRTGNSTHAVQPDIFERDYRHGDGRRLTCAELKRVQQD